MFYGFYTFFALFTIWGLFYFIERKNKTIHGYRLGAYGISSIILSVIVLFFETKFMIDNQIVENKMNAKLITPISSIEDTTRNQYILVYFDDVVKTTSIPKDDVFVSPEKLKIYTFPLTIIQQR